MAAIELPKDVRDWLRDVFRGCNERISEKLTNNPNLPEESLDLTWIEHLSRFTSPVTLLSEWTVKVETHYLGGLRHFRGWEIADIGLLLFVRTGGRISASKVALLQSKRLYPTNNRVREEHVIDYQIGFARIADPEDLARAIAVEADYRFDGTCRYGALLAGSEQVKAISQYQRKNKLRVYYQFYNPWRIPLTQRIPLDEYATPSGKMTLGTRVISAELVHKILKGQKKSYKPTLTKLAGVISARYKYGWPLEYFVCDRFASCHEGDPFESINEDRIQNLFYRRTGPIAAAIAITIESPE